MYTTPGSLLERLRQPSNQEAWARFVPLYMPLLFYWARRLGLQETDAADLVQDVLLTLVQKLPDFSYDQHKSFRSWLRTIMMNKWRDRQRRGAVRPVARSNAALAELPERDQVEVFEEAEYRRQLVGRALELLQGEFRPATWKAFWEHGVSNRSAAEVAAELGVRVGTVYAAKFRVMSRLRQDLQGLLD